MESGRPVVGARVRSWSIGMTTTDAEGRFKIAGQPKRPFNQIEVTIEGQPFIKVNKPVADSPGLGPMRVDAVLKRGVWVEGRVINQRDGQPVKAIVQYLPLRDNPHLKECPDASFLDNNVSDEAEFLTGADGRFRAVALPGRGILTVRTIERNFLTAKPLSSTDAGNVLHAANFEYQMRQYQALVPINPDNVGRVTIPDVVVVPGRTQHFRVIGTDGKPVAGTRLFGRTITDLSGQVSKGQSLRSCIPSQARRRRSWSSIRMRPPADCSSSKVMNQTRSSITLQSAGTVTRATG